MVPISTIYEFYGFLVAKALQQINTLFESALDDTGLNGRLFGTMIIIGAHPGITQKEAGDMQQVDRTTIGQFVDSLCTKALLERRACPNDRRAYCLHLTKQGEETLEKLKGISAQTENDCFAPLTSQEREHYLFLLKKLVKENEQYEQA